MIKIVEYTPDLAPDFLELYRDYRAFYQSTPATHKNEELQIKLLSNQRFVCCLMMYLENKPVGFATWALTMPASEGPALYIKEIYVISPARGHGVGRELMRAFVDIARQHECSRIDWTTDAKNDRARQFYQNLGVEENTGKIFYRVTEAQFSDFETKLSDVKE